MKVLNLIRKSNEVEMNEFQLEALKLQKQELDKKTLRSEVINILLQSTENKKYLEIGTRNPEDNFNKILSSFKKSVDPGLEYSIDSIDYNLTSDEFFMLAKSDELLKSIKWDVVFIDGLHLAEQVYRDIINALDSLQNDGFIVLHDCNPPSEYHARENYLDESTIAGGNWNGTVWKAFYKASFIDGIYSGCIDSDWGIGILTRRKLKCFESAEKKHFENTFFEFNLFKNERQSHLNLMSIEMLVEALNC